MPKATTTPTKIALTEEKRFEFADKMAKTCRKPTEQSLASNRNYYFGQIINQPIRIKGVVTSLADRYDEETAMHITNLVLNRLSTTDLFANTPSLDMEV